MYSIIASKDKFFCYRGNVLPYLNLSEEKFVVWLFFLSIWVDTYPDRKDYVKTLSYEEFVEWAKEKWDLFLKCRWEKYTDFFILKHNEDCSVTKLKVEDLNLDELKFFSRSFKYKDIDHMTI